MSHPKLPAKKERPQLPTVWDGPYVPLSLQDYPQRVLI